MSPKLPKLETLEHIRGPKGIATILEGPEGQFAVINYTKKNNQPSKRYQIKASRVDYGAMGAATFSEAIRTGLFTGQIAARQKQGT